jgi:glutathione S-transferase
MHGPRLYHVAVPGFVHSRAFRCIWLFEELGIDDFEICMLNPAESFTPQMRKHGVMRSQKIPTLQLDGHEISESGVISQVIAEKYQVHYSLLGTSDERLEMLQWIAIAETCITFRIPSLPSLMSDRKSLSELRSEVIQPMRQVFRENIAQFETHFEERESEYLLASGFSVADTMCGWSLHTFHSWGIMDLDAGDSPYTSEYLRRLQARPAFKSAEKYAEVSPGLYGRGCVALPV